MILTLCSFYNGGAREKTILMSAYSRLKQHVHSVFKVCLSRDIRKLIPQIRIPYGMTEDFVVKYLWSAAGYGLMSIPILFPTVKSGSASALRHTVATRTESESVERADR